MDEVLKFRTLHGPMAVLQKVLLCLIPILGIVFIFDLPDYFGTSIPQGQYLSVFLGLILSSVFLVAMPTSKSAPDRVPWYDLILSLLGLVVGLYLAVRYDEILLRMGEPTVDRLILGGIAVLLVLEANRRVSGWILVTIGSLFILYAAYADVMPAGFAGSSVPWPQLVNYLYVDTNSLLGLPLAVAATVVLAFIYFGSVLNSTGVGDFFTNLATSTMGKYRGGAAKVAVFASSMFGMISGSAVSNVVVVGNLTIPLMKKTGYKAHVAGAIESVASTGGQLMPPVMGAAAFIIAQFLAIPYREVAIAAILPAVLYYLCLYVQVDLEAARHGLRGTTSGNAPLISVNRALRSGWQFVLPVLALIYFLFLAAVPESKAGLLAAFLAIVLGLFQSELRRHPGWIIDSLEKTSRVLLDVGVIVALAGLIIGSMQVSGLAFILSNALVNLAGGNIIVLLILTAIVALILGMGMPTSAVYILLAVMVAPALIQMGMLPLAAHLFVFYFGMLSMITPPVCLAAYAAAAIARANFWRTGYEAMRLAGVAYVVPFMFVGSTALLLRGNLEDIVAAAVTAIIGTVVLGIALVGYFVGELNWLKRIVIGLCGVALILPPSVGGNALVGWIINLVGLVIVAPVLWHEWRRRPARMVGAPTEA
ncbi:MAG: TRAP transporter fused permease subunit [Chloroflexi bacterium]|nr:TRAP transporter fused permease subunit [Chloroflexota bacterium]